MNAFKRHLGEQFAALSPLIQQAHIGTIRLEGDVFVRHGNPVARLLCRILNMPREGETVKLVVDGYHESDSMRWNRCFDGHEMRSNFQQDGEFLIEQLGSLKLWLKLSVDDNGSLHYLLKRVSLWAISIPSWLAPGLVASESDQSGGYHFYVKITLPVVGKLIEYGGLISLQADPGGAD